MKLEQAQELYSDYTEGMLTPALQLALEQHFDADPAARADYEAFARVFALLEHSHAQEFDVPSGFRSKLMERAAAEQGRRETAFKTDRGGAKRFQTAGYRRAAGGSLAALAAAVVMGLLLLPHPKTGPDSSGMGGGPVALAQTVSPEMIQSIETQPGATATSHLFHLHLPASVPAATVNAYVVTDTAQITDAAHLSDATPAMQDMHLTNHQGVQIPIAPLAAPPAGSTLDLMVQWTPDDPAQATGSEVVFTPFGPADPATAAPSGANYLDALKAAAAHYGVTIITEADSVPTGTVTADFSGADPLAPLQSMAKSVNYSVQALPGNTYYVYDPKQAH